MTPHRGVPGAFRTQGDLRPGVEPDSESDKWSCW